MRNLIPRFVRPMMRMVGADDRGAVGVLVGMLMATGVLLGMAALTVDVGMLYQERAELQNGADAGSIAVAKTCIKDGTCDPARAAGYANQNAKDGTSDVTSVCGNGPGLSGCPLPSGPFDCATTPPTTNYVDVRTATRTSGGSTLLPPIFARALAGNAGATGNTVHACARAQWGPAAQSANSLAMALSHCAWQQATGGTPPTFGVPTRIFVRDAPNAPTCAGLSRPGEFGWLADSGGCKAAIDLTQSGYISGSDPGKNVTAACRAALASYVTSGDPIFIPIFDTTAGTGSGATYHLIGLAAFVMTGYANMSPLKDVIPAPFGKDDCKAPTTPSCIFGYFTHELMPVSTTINPGGVDFGVSVIRLAG
jgi:Flp pilus assembly protein TadG